MRVKINIKSAPVLAQLIMRPLCIRAYAAQGTLYVLPAYVTDKHFLARRLVQCQQVRRHGQIGYLVRAGFYTLCYRSETNPFKVEAQAAAKTNRFKLYR